MASLPSQWRVAESILTLHHQLRPLAPHASASSFGTVANPATHTPDSDHWPKVLPGLGSVPTVTAGDFPRAENLYPRRVLDAIRVSRDPRVKYGISEGQIFSSYPSDLGVPAWTWRPYGGSDGHFEHGHLSVRASALADNTRLWTIEGDDVSPEDAQLVADKLLATRIKGVTAEGKPFDFSVSDFIVGTNQAAWLAAGPDTQEIGLLGQVLAKLEHMPGVDVEAVTDEIGERLRD